MNIDVRDLIKRARDVAALADSATNGPWEVKDFGSWVVVRAVGGAGSIFDEQRAYANARLCAAARNDVPNLLRQLADAFEAQLDN